MKNIVFMLVMFMAVSVIGAVSYTPYDPSALHLGDDIAITSVLFEGTTIDACETSFKSADPVCDANIILPAPATAGSYYVALSTLAANRPDIANGVWLASNSITLEGTTANNYEAIITAADQTGDTIWTLPVAAAGTYSFVSSTLATNAPEVANSVTGGTNQLIFEGSTADACEVILTATNPTTGDKTITFPASTGTVLLTGRTSQQFIQSIAYAKLGASGAGWVIGAADSISLATLPASQTDENMVIPITVPLKVGTIITGFTINGQIESAGNTATLDASLCKMTAVDSDFTSATIGALAATLSKTADYKIVDGNSTITAETVAADETFFILVEGTTAASTDIAIGGVTLTVTEP
jgi:hypothetical protein